MGFTELTVFAKMASTEEKMETIIDTEIGLRSIWVSQSARLLQSYWRLGRQRGFAGRSAGRKKQNN